MITQWFFPCVSLCSPVFVFFPQSLFYTRMTVMDPLCSCAICSLRTQQLESDRERMRGQCLWCCGVDQTTGEKKRGRQRWQIGEEERGRGFCRTESSGSKPRISVTLESFCTGDKSLQESLQISSFSTGNKGSCLFAQILCLGLKLIMDWTGLTFYVNWPIAKPHFKKITDLSCHSNCCPPEFYFWSFLM